MHDAGAVRLLKRLADLHANFERLLEGHPPFAQLRFQGLALQILHDQIGGSILASHVVQDANVRMIQRRDGTSFPLEALFGFWIFREMRRENFDRNRAIQTSVARAIHFAHAASSQRRLDFVWTEFRPSG